MGEMKIFVERLVWLKQALICLHDIPKDAKFWGCVFHIFRFFF